MCYYLTTPFRHIPLAGTLELDDASFSLIMEHVSEEGTLGDATSAVTSPAVDSTGPNTTAAAAVDGHSGATEASKKQSEEEAAMELSRVSQVGASLSEAHFVRLHR